MSTVLTVLEQEFYKAANIVEQECPRAAFYLRRYAGILGKPKKPKPKRKTVTGYVGSRHVKVKVQGLFEEANKDE